jgi:hypothetical protein
MMNYSYAANNAPSLLYRQHHDAVLGSNNSFRSRIERLGYVFNGCLKQRSDINYAAFCNIRS